jgi:hypothetical protein
MYCTNVLSRALFPRWLRGPITKKKSAVTLKLHTAGQGLSVYGMFEFMTKYIPGRNWETDLGVTEIDKE